MWHRPRGGPALSGQTLSRDDRRLQRRESVSQSSDCAWQENSASIGSVRQLDMGTAGLSG